MSPNQRKAGTVQRTLWIEAQTWAVAQAKAAGEGTNVSALIREFLTNYAQGV